jgi:outer membrane receptor protein involved in Fe transport
LKEFGLKFNHSFSPTFSTNGSVVHFDTALTNVLVDGVLVTGVIGKVQSAQDQANGWEVDYGLHAKVGRGYGDLILTAFDGTSQTALNKLLQAQNFVPRKYSGIAKYTWTEGPLTHLMLGVSMMIQSPKRNSNYLIDTPLITNLFARYQWGKHWNVQLNADNITNERYIIALASNGLVQSAPLFQSRLAIRYNW